MNSKELYKTYDSPHAFMQALKDRLRSISLSKNVPLARLQKRVAFDRLLARFFDKRIKQKPQWLLKGGYALEIRFAEIARATKDIDMSIPSMKNPTPELIHEILQTAAGYDLGDWFRFFIGTYTQDLHQPIYGGWRYPVEARITDKKFALFNIDIAVGDAVIANPEWQKGSEVLSFAGIEPAMVALYPKAQHFAEKIHSFTFPRDKRRMSRVKDIVDLILLIESTLPDNNDLRRAIEATFKRRKTHEIPKNLEAPPDSWKEPYIEIAEDCGVKSKTLQEAFNVLSRYWDRLYKKEE